MSYLEELRAHYKAVKKRLEANAIVKRPVLPPPAPPVTEQKPVIAEGIERRGVIPEDAEKKIISEALLKTNPALHMATNQNVHKLADEILNSPRLPPIPGLVLNESGAVRWMRVLHAVAKVHRIDPSEIMGRSRQRHVVVARFEVFYRLRIDLAFTYQQIARLLRKDHSTVMHGVHKVRQQLLDGRPVTGDYRDADAETPTVLATHTSAPKPGVLAA